MAATLEIETTIKTRIVDEILDTQAKIRSDKYDRRQLMSMDADELIETLVLVNFEDGINEGYAKGVLVGIQEGKSVGERVGREKGYKKGYSQGMKDGKEVGYEKGWNESRDTFVQ